MSATNADLQDDEDMMVRMRKKRETWKRLARKDDEQIQYPNSPKPPVKRGN